MRQKNMTKIAIIGGGASATLLLAHLSRLDNASQLSVDVYDRDGAFAKGVAYSTKEICHLLNVPAFNMSAYFDNPNHFSDWAETKGYKEIDFVPRKLYGEYLQSVWMEAEKKLKINRIQTDVMHSKKGKDGFTLSHSKGENFYNHVITATGNCLPLQVPKITGDRSSYYTSPWVIDERVQNLSHVVLIGSGLSAVDAVLSLQENGFKGKVTLLSRHGFLPEPHLDIVKGKAPWQFSSEEFNGEYLKQKSPTMMLSFIKQEIEKAGEQNRSWHAVIDGLRPYTNTIWQNWDEKERKHFMRHLFTFWNVHRHRMAKEIHAIVEEFNDTNRLQQYQARALEIQADKTASLTLDDGTTLNCDAVINCMGYRYKEGRHFDASYAIGPANFGQLFETTAIPEIRRQSSETAELLNSTLPKKEAELSSPAPKFS